MYKPAVKSIKNIYSFIIVIALSLQLASCSSNNFQRVAEQNKAEIAILMPLSGPYEEQGKRLANLTRLGLEDNLKGLINIITYDVATSELAQSAAQQLLAKNTQIILGPIFSPTVKELSNFVKQHNILMLTLSNNPAVAEENNVFTFGHAPLKQTTRLFGYLFNEQYKDYILLLPANRNATNLSQLLLDMIVSNNGTLVDTVLYTDTPESIANAVDRLAQNVDQLNENIDSTKKPVIYLSEDNKELLGQIFHAFKKYNLDYKAIICGDSRIDIDFARPINLIFTGSLAALNTDLSERLEKNLGSHLNYMDFLAYDIGSITAKAIDISYNSDAFLVRLKSKSWHPGLSGEVRFNGAIAERKYGIIKREGHIYTTIESSNDVETPAPQISTGG